MTSLAEVRLWGRTIGAVALEAQRDDAAFQYDRAFASSGIQIAPLVMPLSNRIYSFPELPRETFHGLPGLLADSLPDRFGNALIDIWLASQGRAPESFDAVERLCYIGNRGMGALEFRPTTGPKAATSRRLQVDALVELASVILTRHTDLHGSFGEDPESAASLADILRVGTSAGGARAKAVIAWNEQTGEVRSGQVHADEGFGSWLLKFDGVSGNRDKELEDPEGYGVIEFAYAEMARAAGIQMSDCRLLEENGRRHFMTRRFDRTPDGGKLHMQSLCALAHYDFNAAGVYSYEQAFGAIRKLGLGMRATEELFRRMAFNVVARNQDDHVKNIAFLMDKRGHWSLAPAFDLTYSYNPSGLWTASHQMSLCGKRDGFTREDFRSVGRFAAMKRGRAEAILREVEEAVARWDDFAKDAAIPSTRRRQIARAHRVGIAES